MDVRRVDDRDVEAFAPRLEAGRDGDAAGAGADDHHVITRIARIGRGLAAIGDAAGNAVHVVAGGLGGAENFRHRAACRLAQRPERGRAGAGAAVSQNGTGKLTQGNAEVAGILVLHETGLDRKITHFQTGGLCRCLDFLEGRLVRTLAIRTVADDGPETGRLGRLNLGDRDLFADGDLRRNCLELHIFPLVFLAGAGSPAPHFEAQSAQIRLTGTLSIGLPSLSVGTSPARMFT